MDYVLCRDRCTTEISHFQQLCNAKVYLRVTNTFPRFNNKSQSTYNKLQLSLGFSFRVVELTVLKTLHLENGTTRR